MFACRKRKIAQDFLCKLFRKEPVFFRIRIAAHREIRHPLPTHNSWPYAEVWPLSQAAIVFQHAICISIRLFGAKPFSQLSFDTEKR